MRVYISLFFIAFLYCLSYGQYSITGKIINQNNQPIEFLDVSLVSNDTLIIDQYSTISDGSFILKTSNGNFELIIEEMGKTLSKRLINIDKDIDLGTIQITSEQQSLKEVVVQGKAKTYERLVDRLVFNVENSISAIGGDALDALKNTPSVKIKNDQISIVGKSTVNVLVNDRILQMNGEDLMSYLKSIPSANIKKN